MVDTAAIYIQKTNADKYAVQLGSLSERPDPESAKLEEIVDTETEALAKAEVVAKENDCGVWW